MPRSLYDVPGIRISSIKLIDVVGGSDGYIRKRMEQDDQKKVVQPIQGWRAGALGSGRISA